MKLSRHDEITVYTWRTCPKCGEHLFITDTMGNTVENRMMLFADCNKCGAHYTIHIEYRVLKYEVTEDEEE